MHTRSWFSPTFSLPVLLSTITVSSVAVWVVMLLMLIRQVAAGAPEDVGLLRWSVFLSSFVHTTIIVTITQGFIFTLGNIAEIRQRYAVILFAVVAPLVGLFLSRTRLGQELIWSIVFRFHLKQNDHMLDIYLALLHDGFAIVTGLLIGFALVTIAVLRQRLK